MGLDSTRAASRERDPARSGAFRGLIILQAIVAAFFGLPGIFVGLIAYWLYRDQGARSLEGPELEPAFRVVLVLATAAATIFGVVPLLLPRTLTELAGFAGTDLVILRLAGAATLGYAVAGVFQILVNRWAEIRLQVIAAIVFNALSAVASAIYLAGGGRSLLGIFILLASTVFTFVLTAFAARAER